MLLLLVTVLVLLLAPTVMVSVLSPYTGAPLMHQVLLQAAAVLAHAVCCVPLPTHALLVQTPEQQSSFATQAPLAWAQNFSVPSWTMPPAATPLSSYPHRVLFVLGTYTWAPVV